MTVGISLKNLNYKPLQSNSNRVQKLHLHFQKGKNKEIYAEHNLKHLINQNKFEDRTVFTRTINLNKP